MPESHRSVSEGARPDKDEVDNQVDNDKPRTCQYFSLMGQVENEVVEAFATGGGVSYDRCPQFKTLMAGNTNVTLWNVMRLL